jgi:hypothetical protein
MHPQPGDAKRYLMLDKTPINAYEMNYSDLDAILVEPITDQA